MTTNAYSDRSVLITGGAGFIGSHLAEGLVKAGARVTILDDLTSGSMDNLEGISGEVRFIEGSILDAASLEESGDGADVVFHHAALVSVVESVEDPESYQRVNVEGTRAVLEMAATHGVGRLLFAGSCSAYGDLPGLPKHEEDAVEPTSPYARTKLDGEALVASFAGRGDLDTACFRYFNVYGPRQAHDSPYAAVVPKFMHALLNGDEPIVFGDGGQTRDFVHVHDIVSANLLAGSHAEPLSGDVFNIGSAVQLSVLEVLHAVAECLGVPARPRHEPAREGEVRDSLASIEKARGVLGYEPTCELPASLPLMQQELR